MYRKLLAASVLTIGLATSAMAQSSDGTYSNHQDWLHHNWLWGNEDSSGVDQNTTGSIKGDTVGGPGGPAGPCAYNSAGPDANHQGNVNDQYCGK
ncbi:hypothetical protein MesoLj113a_48890 [Mesorhizobium sp. 113-1-2]|uniref:hypothetical protein n=1 Tax=Mesorhizobium sp. 113-1-2 TaxID=2744515 RepID=UPI0008199E58|nr:hypothetical protein [Mesorhizobium sp. 113-1-2]BAV45023.1 Uncharacterized protein MLTONO_0120 [Mesorhizobium loti]BCG73731.1 hypothetical protein MesoLj113a_48890 [Mesorhizobium sp. 113-1-2]